MYVYGVFGVEGSVKRNQAPGEMSGTQAGAVCAGEKKVLKG